MSGVRFRVLFVSGDSIKDETMFSQYVVNWVKTQWKLAGYMGAAYSPIPQTDKWDVFKPYVDENEMVQVEFTITLDTAIPKPLKALKLIGAL